MLSSADVSSRLYLHSTRERKNQNYSVVIDVFLLLYFNELQQILVLVCVHRA